MRKTVFVTLAMALAPFGAFAVDGVVLINQSTVMASGGFPYTISQSGSYRLSGNLTVPNANTTAISVTANNVTIDLNGFSIIGPTVCIGLPVTSCSPTGIGDGVQSQRNNIAVVNGAVSGMGRNGVFLQGFTGHVEKVRVDSNGGDGIAVRYGTVSGNTATSNGSSGIDGNHSTVSGNTSSFNNAYGILMGCPNSVVGNTAGGNIQGGVSLSGQGCAFANNAE
jgi:hypothetical protein